MNKALRKIAKEWELDGLNEALNKMEANPQIMVGVLGDFSSGKSTLINEFVAIPDLMPARVEPCTARAALVVADDQATEPKFYRLNEDGELGIVARSTFDDMARGIGSGRPVVHLPPQPAFPSGFVLVDTPGLESLTKDHTAITVGELPFFDAALLCIDIQKGGVTGTEKKFLLSPGVRHLKHRFILALTHGDKKSEKEREKIRSKVVGVLAAMLGINEQEARDRVIIVSAGPKSNSPDVGELKTTLMSVVAEKAEALQAERRKRQSTRLIPFTIQLLKDRCAATQEGDSEFGKRKLRLDAEIAKQEQELVEHRTRLGQLQTSLQRDLRIVCERHQTTLAAVIKDEDLQKASSALSVAIEEAVKGNVGAFVERFDKDLGDLTGGVRAHLAKINKRAVFLKNIAAIALMAAVLPAPAGAGQAAEGAAGLAAHKAGEVGAKQVVIKAAKQGMVKKMGFGLLKAIDDINPVQFVGDWIAGEIKENALTNQLGDIASSVARETSRQLESIYHEMHFSPIADNIAATRKMLVEVELERKQSQERRQKDVARLSAAIVELETAAEEAERIGK